MRRIAYLLAAEDIDVDLVTKVLRAAGATPTTTVAGIARHWALIEGPDEEVQRLHNFNGRPFDDRRVWISELGHEWIGARSGAFTNEID
jgi:hypothetical protein